MSRLPFPYAVAFLALASVVAAGCSDHASADTAAASQKAEAGTIVGTAKTQDGKPLASFGGHISGTSLKSGGLITADIDGKDGAYKTNVGPGQFGIRAWTDVDYNGHKYRIDLCPVDGKPVLAKHDTTAGVVKDFVWRLEGFRPGVDERSDDRYFGHFGGSVMLSAEGFGGAYQTDVMNDYSAKPEPMIAKDATVELTLTPDGPLIDGSAGKPFVFALKLAAIGNYKDREKSGIAIGRYNATAVEIAADGSRKPLRVVTFLPFHKGTPAGPAASVPIEFLQKDPPSDTINKVDEVLIHVMH